MGPHCQCDSICRFDVAYLNGDSGTTSQYGYVLTVEGAAASTSLKPMISYAQTFEDVMLNRCFGGKVNGFYIDIGAMDPSLVSVTKHFYDLGWSGINVEPNEWFFQRLLQERPRDINLNLAAAEQMETKVLYVVEKNGNSTFDPKQRDRLIEQGQPVVEKPVRTTSLADICRQYVRSGIDFLKIDCEGWEEQVLRGADWDRYRPTVVVVEATKPFSTIPTWHNWEPTLTKDGAYEMVYFDGLNRYYLRREYLDLRCHFETPPNVLDGFSLEVTEQALRDKEALRVEKGFLMEQKIVLEADVAGLVAEREALLHEIAALKELAQEKDSALEALQIARHLEGEQRNSESAGLREEILVLKKEVRVSRIWVGQLSQEVVSAKIAAGR